MQIRTIKLISTYLAAMIAGAVLYAASLEIYARIRFNRDLEIIATSHDYEELYQVYYGLLPSARGREIICGVVSNYCLNPTIEARHAALDVIQEEIVSSYGPTSSLADSALSRRYYDGVNDPEKEIRTRSLQIYNNCLRRSLVSMIGIATQLPYEPSPELAQKQLDLIARFLFLDKQELQKQVEENGLESIRQLVLKRFAMTMSEEERKAHQQEQMDYEERLKELGKEVLGKDVEVRINN